MVIVDWRKAEETMGFEPMERLSALSASNGTQSALLCHVSLEEGERFELSGRF